MDLATDFITSLRGFRFQDGPATLAADVALAGTTVARYENEFWTPGQRQASALHEVSYRACFKPQLPRFFIGHLTREGDAVYDPFSGRGTTALEAGLLGRRVVANDINPLSVVLTRPRFFPPAARDVEERLRKVPIDDHARADIDLSMFYHPRTEAEIVSLRRYLQVRKEAGCEDDLDAWVRMVATNRLTGHSRGFFSVYTLPPNQAVLPGQQEKINRRKGQVPEYRDTRALILKKTASLLRGVGEHERARLRETGEQGLFLTRDSRDTPEIPPGSVQLTVTSPPFLDVVQYSRDNWLRCWFNGIDPVYIEAGITVTRSLPAWLDVMGDTFRELYRITRPGGFVAFEVGEVRRGTLRLDEAIVPQGLAAGFSCLAIVVNRQRFTKTSHIWGIGNNELGTNTNRIVVFRKE
jgi:hypothetical protein